MSTLLNYLDAETTAMRALAARDAVCRPDLADYAAGYSDAYAWAADSLRAGVDPHDVAAAADAGPCITASSPDALRGAQDGYMMVAYELEAAARNPELIPVWLRAIAVEPPPPAGAHDRRMAQILLA
jgi:hypothetical protein